MNRLGRLFAAFSRKPSALALILLFAFVLHSGTSIVGGLYADDYIHAAYFQGNPLLAEKGLLDGIKVGEPVASMRDMFSFFDPKVANYQPMRDFGMLPWWTGENAMLHFFRPLAAITHYLDYRLWPGNSHMMHFINLLWYMLGLLAIYRLYQGVGVEKSVALLALLIVVLDQSVFQVVTWIAARSMLMIIAIGFFCVYAYHKSLHSSRWYLLSLLLLTVALFTAEGAIGICAYLGAYLFMLDSRRWPQRILHILPFVLVTLGWRLYYQAQGFGAYGVDFYLDPGQEPGAFLHAASYRLPGNFFELFTGFDVFSGQVRPDIRQQFAIGGVLLFVGLLWLLAPAIRQNRKLGFFWLGSLFALVPGLSIALAPRTMILPNVGFAVVMAHLVYYSAKALWPGGRKWLANILAVYIVLVHLLLSTVVAGVMTWNIIDLGGEEKLTRGNVDIGIDDFAGQHVVIFNAIKPFWVAFIAHELAYRGEALPATVRVLSSAFYPVSVTRLDANTLQLTADPAFQLDPQPVTDYSGMPAGHYAYLTQQLLGLMRGQRDAWRQGEVVSLPEMTIEVARLYNGKPSELKVKLLQPLASYRWVYWDMQEMKYKPVALPEVGETLEMQGLF